jgi:uncharacterized protein (DUF433 family)
VLLCNTKAHMARPRSFRFSDALLTSLQERARERGESANALAERYLEEGLRREEHPLIAFRAGAAGRRAALVGTRLDVSQVIDTLRESANAIDATAEHLEIPEQHVRAAVRYYADFRDEVDEWRERMRAIAEREEEAWRREQAVLA